MLVLKEKSGDYMLKNIEKKRKEMLMYGENTGLTSSETLKCSKELDQLIYNYLAHKDK
ncbi:aspartyl-phosphate phosphatase Spo0E family protein [Pueribacillus theae]|nr:aspartyl-phosphate phosphatase Spo0E family protein [Pueribacillus theae]